MKNEMMNFKKHITRLAAGVVVLFSTGANATLIDGIVDIWTVGVSGGFLCGTAVFTPNATGTSCAAQSMRWGTSTGSGQSGLDITNLPPAQVVTNGAAVANTSVTHLNRPITGNSLDEVTLRSTLTLTPFDPAAAGLPPAAIDFDINFEETPNGANPCADGGVNGVGVNVNGCSDIFVVDQSALNFPFLYDLLSGQGPKLYFISFFEQTNGLNPLSDAACTAAGAAPGCLGFQTAEQVDTPIQFAALITTTPVNVPEPTSLLLIGLGLTGVGFARRRSMNS